MGKIIRLTESDLVRLVKKVVNEEQEENLLKKLARKLKGISDEQLNYNVKNNLPWDWDGTKEGYHEHITKKKFPKGSN
jgi:hypothetical protein